MTNEGQLIRDAWDDYFLRLEGKTLDSSGWPHALTIPPNAKRLRVAGRVEIYRADVAGIYRVENGAMDVTSIAGKTWLFRSSGYEAATILFEVDELSSAEGREGRDG